jgi:hypothetical protein
MLAIKAAVVGAEEGVAGVNMKMYKASREYLGGGRKRDGSKL